MAVDDLSNEATVPQAEIEVPQAEATLPSEEMTMPQAEAPLPQAEIEVPQAEATLPEEERTVPQADTTLPQDETTMPFDEFVKLPTTVDFQVINTDRVIAYAKERPYLRFGTKLANDYIVGYTNEKYIPQLVQDFGGDVITLYPKIMSPLDSKSNDAAGITQVLNQPFLNLSGYKVIIGIVDTGIDYTNGAFQFEDGTSKIFNLWDQTVDGPRADDVYFGATYDKAQIDLALKVEDPYSIVPSVDESGHGTFLASVAASNAYGEFIGAAPKANLMIVKLRRARQFYIDAFLLPKDNPELYESTDYLLGIKFILDEAEKLNLPVVMCIGMGSNWTAHDGNSLFENYLSFVSQRIGYCFVTAGGNESNAKHHTEGKIPYDNGTDTISLKVGTQGESFFVTIYAPAFDKISVGITSPTGEVIPRIPFKSGLTYSESLVMENTTISVRYFKNINTNIIVGFQNTTQGIWDITIFGDAVVSGQYWSWLPITGQVSSYVEFLKPVPEHTIVYPSTGLRTITCGAYSSDDDSLYVSSSWGPTRMSRMAPDFVAPGVRVKGIYPIGFGTMTGTSVAAAVATGAAALLMEWGIINKNMLNMNGDLVRSLLISGCTREKTLQYPNIKWGYGKINLNGTFSVIRETHINYNISTP